MNQRFTSTAVALLLLVALPAGAARAAEVSTSVTVETAVPAMPAPAPYPGGAPAPIPEPKLTSAEAEAILAELFTLPQPTDKLSLNWSLSRQGSTPTWELMVTIREGSGSTGFGLATVDALTGRILRYGGYGMLPAQVRTGPLGEVHDQKDALEKALAFLKAVAPDREMKETPFGSPAYPYSYGYGMDSMADTYNFTFVEHHNGIPFLGSTINVGVHKQTLAYTHVNVSLMDGIKFQEGPAKVTPEEALKLWQAEANPKLAYQPVYNMMPYGKPGATRYKLAYTFGDLGRAVDAMTGTWAKDPGPAAPAQGVVASPESVPAGDVNPVVATRLPLNEMTARSLALSILKVPPGAELRSEGDYYPDEKVFRFSYWDGNQSGSVMLEPKTGLIRNAYRSRQQSPPAGPDSKVTPEQEAQAKQAAITLVQTYFSQYRDQLKLEPVIYFGPQENDVRRFAFTRYVRGLPVHSDSISVTIDLATMKWVDLYANWSHNVTFPNPYRAIDPEKAKATIMADRQPVLVYRAVYPAWDEQQMRMGRMPQPSSADLVYVLKPDQFFQVDALTGQPLSHDGQSVSDMEEAYKAVAGHWAEGELQFLLARRVLRPDQVNPDGALTRGHAVALLLHRTPNSIRYGQPQADPPYSDLTDNDPFYQSVRTAWTEGWLRPVGEGTKFRASDAITRAEFAVWAARTLGLGDLARSGLAVQAEYKDLAALTAEERNAASFLQALGLLPAGDSFRGGELLTQAEAAALTVQLYNRLLSK